MVVITIADVTFALGQLIIDYIYMTPEKKGCQGVSWGGAGLLERVVVVKVGMPSVPSTLALPGLVAQSHRCPWLSSAFLSVRVAPIDPHSVAPISTGMNYNPIDVDTIKPKQHPLSHICRSPNGMNHDPLQNT